MQLKQVIDYLASSGLPCYLCGDGEVRVVSVNTLEDAKPGEISFLANPKYAQQLKTTKASAVLVSDKFEGESSLNLIRTPEPYAALTALMVRLHGHRQHTQWGISEWADVADSAILGQSANVAPHVTIGEKVVAGRNLTVYPGCYIAPGCVLGDDVTLYPNVVLYEMTQLGSRVSIHAGTVIGEDGLGYAPVDKKWVKIPQVGRVQIGDDVEIGANCTIDRATLGSTIIGSGTKFSNLIAIGHGSKIGSDCMFVAQVGIAGSVTVGRHVTMAGQAGVVGHIRIGENATVGAKAGVTSNVAPDVTVLGQPAVAISDARRQFASIQRLPDMRRRLRDLEREVEYLREQIDSELPHQNVSSE